MKSQALIQYLRKTLHTAFLTFLILTLSSIQSCDIGYDLDWNNWDPCNTAPALTGTFQVSDDCTTYWGSKDYTITIQGACPNYTISNLFAAADAGQVSVTYTPYVPAQLSISEQTYTGWTINGSGIIKDGLITLSMNLYNESNNMTCTVSGHKK